MSTVKDIVSAFDEVKEKMTALEKLLKKGKFRKASSSSEDKPKREAGPWAIWAKECKLLHPEEFVEYKAEHETNEDGEKVKGVHIHFATHWRKEHPEEYEAFAKDLKEKRASASESASASEAEKPAKKTTATSKKSKKESAESSAESSDDEKPKKAKAKPKAKKSDSDSEDEKPTKKPKASEAKPKASEAKPKASEAKPKASETNAKKKKEEKKPVASEEAETENVSAELWEHKGKSYFRTSQNDCWHASAEGEMGAWAGRYDPIKDKIDPSAKEPEFEH
jgi:colicin import membrane protein